MNRFLESQYTALGLFIAIFSFWVIGLWYDLYFFIWWYDVSLHFASGFLAFLIFRFIVSESLFAVYGKFSWFIYFLCALGFIAFLGVIWEFYEFVSDRYVFHNGFTFLPYVYEDTLSDLFLDLMGTVVGFLLLKD